MAPSVYSPTVDAKQVVTDAGENPARAEIAALCARDLEKGLDACQSAFIADCIRLCAQSYRDARTPKASTSDAGPARPPDPYMMALADCFSRVRDSGQQPACRFFRPLDEMSFGQKHCDAKCAELTETYRTIK